MRRRDGLSRPDCNHLLPAWVDFTMPFMAAERTS